MKQLGKISDAIKGIPYISIWYFFKVRPLLSGIKHSIKRAWYVYNLPTVTKVLNIYNEDSDSNNVLYYKGNVRALYPIDLKVRSIVKTKYGIGRISSIIYRVDNNGYYTDVIQKINVDMLSNNGKSRGFSKLLNERDITQLLVYHHPAKQFVRLTPKDYAYIIKENQEIEYRITNRKFAELSPASKAKYEYIKIFNDKRGGANILKALLKKGYVIQRQ
jgi:hypothetical protein